MITRDEMMRKGRAVFARNHGLIEHNGVFYRDAEIYAKVVPGHEGHIATIDGDIYRYLPVCGEWRVCAKRLMSGGYYQTRIDGKDILTHRIIAKCFCANPDDKPEVNHINGNKLDNRRDNLEWVTRAENMLHAYTLGLHPRFGSKPLSAVATV